MKRFFAIILLGYLILAFYLPEIFLKNWIFLPILIITFLIFFFELNFNEKKYLFLVLLIAIIILIKPLPQLCSWIMAHYDSILVAIALGIIIPFLIVSIAIIVLIYLINKFIKNILGINEKK